MAASGKQFVYHEGVASVKLAANSDARDDG
jgi:hypothetical protein